MTTDISFKESLNPSVRPQDDFYEFVNGTWLKNNPIPGHLSRWGSFNVLREENLERLKLLIEKLLQADQPDNSAEAKLSQLYAMGLNDDAVRLAGEAELKKWLQRVQLAKTPAELWRILAELHALDIPLGFNWYVDFDDHDSNAYAFRFTQGGLSMPDRDYYTDPSPQMSAVREKYRQHLAIMAQTLEKLVGISFEPQTVYAMEERLAKASMTAVEQRDVEKQYNPFTPAQLQERFTNLDWQGYFTVLGIAPSRVLVNQTAFFDNINSLFAPEYHSQLRHYTIWHIFKKFSPFLGEAVELSQFAFYGTVLSGVTEIQPRWKRVLGMLDALMGDALGKLYVDSYFTPAAKERCEMLVADLRASFGDRIDKLTWMSQVSKELAHKKLQNFTVKIGYPENWRDYSPLTLIDNNYIQSIFRASRYEAQRHLAKVGSVVDRSEWFMTAPTVNAYHYPNLVEIVFPAGILQFPFFAFEADDAINYGGIGSVIGHELTHGFDDQGSQFDASGNFKNWRTPEEQKAFAVEAQKLVDQANKFEIQPGLTLNGQLTLGENIADLGGVAIAFDAFKKAMIRNGRPADSEGFSAEQRFFMSYARTECSATRPEKERELAVSDPHAHSKFRVNEILKNVDAFYEAFGVKEGDAMYIAQKDRVVIW